MTDEVKTHQEKLNAAIAELKEAESQYERFKRENSETLRARDEAEKALFADPTSEDACKRFSRADVAHKEVRRNYEAWIYNRKEARNRLAEIARECD